MAQQTVVVVVKLYIVRCYSVFCTLSDAKVSPRVFYQFQLDNEEEDNLETGNTQHANGNLNAYAVRL